MTVRCEHKMEQIEGLQTDIPSKFCKNGHCKHGKWKCKRKSGHAFWKWTKKTDLCFIKKSLEKNKWSAFKINVEQERRRTTLVNGVGKMKKKTAREIIAFGNVKAC